MFMSMLDGVHRAADGRVAIAPTIRYWWALMFPAKDGEVSGRALTPAERENVRQVRARAAIEERERREREQGCCPDCGTRLQPHPIGGELVCPMRGL